ncbi:MAG: helix-turn-helix transcriptional regulator [Clostridiales bacterium]|nr:helix-turn-helix transcriptional regulator [Clostridiales bacterium]
MSINDILKNPWDIFNEIDDETKQEFELSNMLVDIACKIINYRLDNDLTQQDLAKKLNKTQAMVSKLESGEYNPTIEFLYKISKKLGWKFELIFEEINNEDGIILNMEKEQILNEKTRKEIELLKGLAS